MVEGEFNIKHWNYAQEKHIKIWMCKTKSNYSHTKYVNGRKTKITLPYVNICVSLDGNNTRFKDEFKQNDEELPYIINKLYKYYYERGNS